MQRAQWLAILLYSSEESEALLQLDVLLGGRGPDVYLSVCFLSWNKTSVCSRLVLVVVI